MTRCCILFVRPESMTVVAAAGVEAGELAVGSEQQQQRFNNRSISITISQQVYEANLAEFINI